MWRTLKNAFKVPELRLKLIVTIVIILAYRIGANIVVPFVSQDLIKSFDATYGGTVFGFLSILSGGALSQATLFALSVSPYITASIVMQLLTIAIPKLERMAKEEDGKKKIASITRWVTVALALITAIGYEMLLNSNGWLTKGDLFFNKVVIIACFCAGAAIVMWLAEKINEFGIGNGISIILFANIISRLPNMVMTGWRWTTTVKTAATGTAEASYTSGFNPIGLIEALAVAVCIIGLIVLSVWFTNSERRIPIQYAKRVVGRKMYGGQGTNLPLKMNMAGVMPIIFASSIVSLPATIYTLFGGSQTATTGFGGFINNYLQSDTWFYIVLYMLLLFAFSYFYISISFNPTEVANNIRNNGGAVPGIRPGKPTTDYIKKILTRVTFIGAIFLAVVAGVPMVVGFFGEDFKQLAFGGSSLLIVVGVALETMHDIEAQLTMRNYKGFLD